MKTTSNLLFLLLFVLWGCSDDSDEDQLPANYYSIDGTVYELTNAYLADGSIFLTSGLTITGLEQSTNDPIFQGTGNLVGVVEISGQGNPTTGQYELQEVEGEVLLNWDPALTSYDYQQFLNNGSGTCNLSLNGLTCTLEINGTLQDGKSLVVDFGGTLTEITN